MSRTPKTQPVKPGSRAAAPSIRGEKRVQETHATIPVKSAKRVRGMHDGPTDPAAVDRRIEITGTDELPPARLPKSSAVLAEGKRPRGRTGGPARRS